MRQTLFTIWRISSIIHKKLVVASLSGKKKPKTPCLCNTFDIPAIYVESKNKNSFLIVGGH